MKLKMRLLVLMLCCRGLTAWGADALHPADFKPTESRTTGSVTVDGTRIDYRAIAGTLVVHAKGWRANAAPNDPKNPAAEASMFYVAYFRRGVAPADRPITFLFNGCPGSSTIWLHMGAQSFYGVDQDIHAFAVFIREFLSRYDRWNSPKYLYGESYGTMRAAGLALALQREDIDLNGVMLQSLILDWDLMPDDPRLNPSVDLPYIVALPSYAATAWYHHALPGPPQHLHALLARVEHFATTDYALALLRGNALPAARRQAIADQLHADTGLPVAYLLQSDLRIEYGAFQQELLAGQYLTTGTLDTRFTGPTLDPLSRLSEYDPQSAAIGSAYVSAFNAYVRDRLHYGQGMVYKPEIPVYASWDYRHQPPGAHRALIALPNVLPDLAVAMKRNPDLQVMVNSGYFDLSTPYYEGWFELHHLPIPPILQRNIEYRYYRSGHMIYVHRPALKQLHDQVAAFIRRTDDLPGSTVFEGR